MKILINLPGMLHDHNGSPRIFTTDGKLTYGCGAKLCYLVKELGHFVPAKYCVGVNK